MCRCLGLPCNVSDVAGRLSMPHSNWRANMREVESPHLATCQYRVKWCSFLRQSWKSCMPSSPFAHHLHTVASVILINDARRSMAQQPIQPFCSTSRIDGCTDLPVTDHVIFWTGWLPACHESPLHSRTRGVNPVSSRSCRRHHLRIKELTQHIHRISSQVLIAAKRAPPPTRVSYQPVQLSLLAGSLSASLADLGSAIGVVAVSSSSPLSAQKLS